MILQKPLTANQFVSSNIFYYKDVKLRSICNDFRSFKMVLHGCAKKGFLKIALCGSRPLNFS